MIDSNRDQYYLNIVVIKVKQHHNCDNSFACNDYLVIKSTIQESIN